MSFPEQCVQISRALKLAILAALITMVLATNAPARAEQTEDADARIGLFGYLEFASPQLTALPLWRDALARIAAERARIALCDADVSHCASTALTVWRAKVAELRTLNPLERLFEVNRFVNSFPQRSDPDAHETEDYWASPLEFLDRGGDAEDFAIMKFASLRDADIDNEALRIMVVYDALRQQRHAILAVTLEDGTFILDTVTDAVQPVERVRYYVPYYSVNETTRWAHVVRPPRPADG